MELLVEYYSVRDKPFTRIKINNNKVNGESLTIKQRSKYLYLGD